MSLRDEHITYHCVISKSCPTMRMRNSTANTNTAGTGGASVGQQRSFHVSGNSEGCSRENIHCGPVIIASSYTTSTLSLRSVFGHIFALRSDFFWCFFSVLFWLCLLLLLLLLLHSYTWLKPKWMLIYRFAVIRLDWDCFIVPLHCLHPFLWLCPVSSPFPHLRMIPLCPFPSPPLI